MAQSSPEGIVFDKDSALIKMKVSVNEEPILEVGKDTADYIDKHIVAAMVEVAKNEITLKDVFNDEKREKVKEVIHQHKVLKDLSLVNPLHLQMTSNGHGEFPDGYKLTEKGIQYIIEQLNKE
jgi:hypothetical protein